MKNLNLLLPLIIAAFLIYSCTPDPKLTPPVLTSAQVTQITYTTATAGGELTDIGGAYITAKGVCWSTSVEPTIDNNKTTESGGLGVFTSQLTGLTPNTMYYVRAYGTNSAGTAYGNEVSFKTLQLEVPVLTTTEITSITQTTAVSGGNITDDNGGSVTARGVCWGIVTNPTTADSKTTDGTGTGTFTSSITALTAGTVYYVRAYATNSVGTAYGNEISFTTAATVPVLTTTAASAITQTTATSGGNITSDGGATVTARGVCWSTTTGPTTALSTKTTDGTGTGTFTSSITALTAGTVYYVRAYATNSAGTSYGNEISFTIQTGIVFNPNLTYGSVTDIDGNVYKTIIIGTQTWMAENLKTTKYNDGTGIPLVTDNTAWQLSTPGYCWYNNDEATYKATYGALYNWSAVDAASNGGKNVCPTGWHVPTDVEWTTLTDYLGGESVAGGKLKEAGLMHWWSPNTGATNESGFTALPGGCRGMFTGFDDIGWNGSLWSATDYYSAYAWYRFMHSTDSNVGRDGSGKQTGWSVRCLKDN